MWRLFYEDTKAATLEYAVTALQVTDIVVCGHSSCGAIQGLLQPELLDNLHHVKRRLVHSRSTHSILENHPELQGDTRTRIAVKLNVLAQLAHLRTHPCVSAALSRKDLRLHGWYYDIPTGVVLAFDVSQDDFVPLTTHAPAVEPHPRDLKALIAQQG